MEKVCSVCQEEAEIKTTMKLKVLHTPAGYYLGFWCDNHGPYSRETHYFRTREEAQNLLDMMKGK
jgi:hypothetical protein